MRTRSSFLLAVMLLAVMVVSVAAQDSTKSSASAQMPPMGAPDQMKEMAYMVGEWDVKGELFLDPASNYSMSFTAKATFEYALDSAALIMHYQSSMMGMPRYLGMSITTYDREKQQWQDVWMDNMSARMAMMTGQETGDMRVMEGKDTYQGKEMLSRQTSSNITKTSYDWKLEQPLDQGKTWRTIMTATYTKKK